MRRTTTTLIATGALIAVTAGAAAATHGAPHGMLDASCNPPGSGGFIIFRNDTSVAQTFVPGQSASLLSVRLIGLHRQPGGVGGPVNVEVRTTNPTTGAPTSTVLASSAIPASEITANAMMYDALVDFAPAQAASLTAGQTYALVLSTPDTVQNGWNLAAGPCVGSLWQGGDTAGWGHHANLDSTYETYLGPANAANDAFGASELLPGTDVTVPGTTLGATRQAGEPDHYEMNVGGDFDWVGEHSVWYRWRSLGTGPVALNTCTAAIDSIVAVYTGSTLSGLSRVTDGNNGCPSGWGTDLAFSATAGTTYRIAVADAGGATQDTFQLDLVGPPNEAPKITSIRPPDGATIADHTPTVAATVRDSATNLAASNITLRIDGVRKTGFSYDRSTDRLTFTTGQLASGQHTVRVRAADAQGLATVRDWSFQIS